MTESNVLTYWIIWIQVINFQTVRKYSSVLSTSSVNGEAQDSENPAWD